jgi:hypothetical protein
VSSDVTNDRGVSDVYERAFGHAYEQAFGLRLSTARGQGCGQGARSVDKPVDSDAVVPSPENFFHRGLAPGGPYETN